MHSVVARASASHSCLRPIESVGSRCGALTVRFVFLGCLLTPRTQKADPRVQPELPRILEPLDVRQEIAANLFDGEHHRFTIMPRKNRSKVRSVYLGIRLTAPEHAALMKVLARENQRRTRRTKSFPMGEPLWTVSDLVREWIGRASRARSYILGD
jgi:hypothetical protein